LLDGAEARGVVRGPKGGPCTKLTRAVVLPLLLLLSPAPAVATTNIGLYDFGQGSALLDHLIVSHGLDAAYTRYAPGSFGSVSDFSVQNVWLVPSNAGYAGLRSNTSFQSGSAFSRVVITGLDPDTRHPSSEASSGFMLNALQWVAQGPKPGLIILADYYSTLDWLPPSWGVPRAQASGCFDSVSVDPGQTGHPVNAGLTTTLLSSWGCSANDYFAADIADWTTLHRLGSGPQPITIARDFCVGPPGDCDGDGVADGTDNCPGIANADQADGDGDGIGDACDNCPAVANADQADRDSNGIGDACQDTDGDGIIDIADNCPTTANADQADADGDGVGDVCDICPGHDDHQDTDHDGVPDGCDNCPAAYNPSQADGNGNGIGDACDDRDGDGVVDASDNCVDTPNPGQEDHDHDGVGDACDPCTDTDGDGFGNPGFPQNTCPVDNCPFIYNPDQRDSDGDGVGDACVVCTALGPALSYPLVVQKSIIARRGHGTGVFGSACTGRATLSGTSFEDISRPANLIATAASGTAVRFLPDQRYGYFSSLVDGDIATGGGAVRGISPYLVSGVIDTSGTYAGVADCASAMAAARRASATLAALPPTRVLGNVHVAPGEEVDIDAGEGGVVQIDSLTMDGVPGYCPTASGGFLLLSGNHAVFNVKKRLDLGNCADLAVSGVFNVPGKGPTIRIGSNVGPPPILAPDRTLVVAGDIASDNGTFLEQSWVSKLVIEGGLTILEPDEGLCF